MPAPERIRSIADEDTFEEWDRGIEKYEPVWIQRVSGKGEALKQTTGLDEAVVTGKGAIHGIETALGVCDGRFLMASMGEVVGEKITRMVERATEEKLPVIIFTCSGGARMQEGIVSLMQMAKTSCRTETSQRRWTSLYYGADRSNNRWRDGKFCYAWRYHTGRAGSTDWICRSSCH